MRNAFVVLFFSSVSFRKVEIIIISCDYFQKCGKIPAGGSILTGIDNLKNEKKEGEGA